MHNKIIILSALILSGCATTQQPAPIVITKEVKVPVRVPCTINTPMLPKWAVPLVAKGSDVYTQIQALLADRELSIAYQNELLIALESCKK